MRAAEPWTRERVAKLERLWAEGETAQSIAGLLGGMSRSAVLGKIFRLRLETGMPAPAALAANRTPRESDARKAAAVAPARRRRSGKRDDLQEGRTADRRRGKSLLELTNESCRWPHGSPGTARFHFCGEPGANLEGGMPYCPLHAQRAYRKRPATSESMSGPPRASAVAVLQSTEAAPGRRRYMWRALVRHPAPRWK
jgi:GcrA cell cycle regulator